jgi:hypothetical protein
MSMFAPVTKFPFAESFSGGRPGGASRTGIEEHAGIGIQRHLPYAAMIMLMLLATACSENNTGSYIDIPGREESVKLKVLEVGAKLVQDREPLDAVTAYLDGFHFYNGDMDGQMEAHHYVTVLNEDVMQAVIYDGNTRDARLMGVEYIISARLFDKLDPEEKKLWHSHQYEVKSGALVGPGLPALAEKQLMEKIVSTYGKTWHTWHTDRDKELPYGIPALMMGFTKEGQLDPRLLNDRDKRFGISTANIKKQRESISMPQVDKMANAWENDDVVQLARVKGVGEHAHGQHSSSSMPAGDKASELSKSSRIGDQQR